MRLCAGLFVITVITGISMVGVKMSWGANVCVVCHQSPETMRSLPHWYQDVFVHWYGSVHGKKGVTCEKCHGGDSTQSEKELAHKGVMPSGDPASRVYYEALPKTCGSCHKEVYQQFVQSRHYKNLEANRLAPTCTTCHGIRMDIGPVVPLLIASRCPLCHNSQQGGVKPEVASLAVKTLEKLAETKRTIQKAEVAIELVKEQRREPKAAEKLLKTAQDRLRGTGALWHRFRLDDFKRELIQIQGAADEAYSAATTVMLKK